MRFLLSIIALISLSSSHAIAQSKIVTFPSDGREKTIQLGVGDQGIKDLVLFAEAPGNDSIQFNFNITSNINVPVSLKYAQRPNKRIKPAALVAKKKLWFPLNYRDGEKNVSKFSSNGSAPKPKKKEDTNKEDPECGCFTAAEIEQYLAWGLGTTKEEFCAGVKAMYTGPVDCGGGDAGDNPGLIGGVSGRVGFFHKDACVEKDYAVQASIDLKKVDPSYFESGIEFKVSLVFTDYDGDKASALKPESDGRFAPKPLFLMSSIGYPIAIFGDREEVHVLEFKKGKLVSKKELNEGDLVGYRGQFLRREPAFFTGRCATVEMIHEDSSTGYSHKFILVPRRQNVGGYEGPSS